MIERYEIIERMNKITRGNGYREEMGIEQKVSFLQHAMASLLRRLMNDGNISPDDIKDILDGY